MENLKAKRYCYAEYFRLSLWERSKNEMLIFGHAGITLGAAILLNGAFSRSHSLPTRENKVEERLRTSSEVVPVQNCASDSRASWLTSLGNRIDIRLLLLGSLLPDIIDKPIGQFLFIDTFSNGRIFCHTLLFLILITLAGYYLYQNRGKLWLLILSLGTFMHLIQDQMWLEPRTLLWPLYGFAFERIDLTYWMQNILYALRTEPDVYLPELVGAGILIWFVFMLGHRRKVYAFIRNGQV
ncbi:metal-dependent hydrolase [Dehalococcoidales bacterium]|nr:metal-dependent hydrolase [Dehalococcoidales bacterium]